MHSHSQHTCLLIQCRRSLGQFQGLLEYKAGALPVPDVLITAVGTKIWRLDVQVRRMGHCVGGFGAAGLQQCGCAGSSGTDSKQAILSTAQGAVDLLAHEPS